MSGTKWVDNVFEQGLLGTGATLAARLLEFELNAHLTNVLLEGGWAEWWEIPAGTQKWRKRILSVDPTLPFPYGQNVEPA